MSFPDHNIKSEYRSLIDNVVQDFYLPILGDAICYKRAVGVLFFFRTGRNLKGHLQNG